MPSTNQAVDRLRSDRPGPLRLTVAGLLAAAGGLHLAALPGHLAESAAAGLFFAAAALGQFFGAVLLGVRPTRRTTAVIIAGNLVVLGIWALSRTTGLPLGGELGAPEPVTVLDALATAAEILVVAGGLVVVGSPSAAGRRRGGWQPAVAVAVTWLVSGALATGLAAPHHHHHDHAVRTGTRTTALVSDGPLPPADQPSPASAPTVFPASTLDDPGPHTHAHPCPAVHRCDRGHQHDDH